MSEEFKFSDPGEGLQEAEVLEIHVAEGDHVNDGDTVLTVETDKAATDVSAPFSGTIEKVHLKTGDVVRVDDLLFSYVPDDGDDEEDTDSGEQGEKDEEDKKDEKDQEEETSESDDENQSSKESTRESSEESAEDEKAEESDQEAASDEDEEQGDRQEKDDEGEKKRQEKQPDKTDKKTARKAKRDQPPVPAAPSTRRLARERGVDLHDIEPSGPQGRVTTEDVEAAAKEGGRQPPGSGKALPDFSQWGDTERVAIRSVRRVTAERMTQSWTQIPHVYHQDVADVTELERFRHDYEASAQENGGKFTLTILVMKAMVFALKQFPHFNASLDNENQEIVLKRYFHVGLAVATERGLLVPVIRDVDKKNLIELTEAVSTTVERARNGELGREDMEGGCMTLTNPGPLGGTALTPLINLPEVAILGLGQARLEPVVHGDLDNYEVKPRLLLPLSLGFDHRVNDGADAANFVTTLIGALEDPQSLLLKI
ncbi:pyruvate dehydrogenase E2 component (dihydrolipoamide acetyltransferase) [Modicisalibacter muralis]|uniref:Dihydrolipoamide acetyltransferase component of pyruvate dehydrogenase complex n=1 Tax=Modicisalibacter muralis TaxID=119000 RepID=A0A1G9GIK3_9GAMM|nr:dihydrolipoamide acetyltransferase family protein [Halomonas muralis]SDL00487.1 pyruvate dehydrogenase E2 component (dihydrolipoamide acetyltransferase) [Halomonas muralis]